MRRDDFFQRNFNYSFHDSCDVEASQLMLDACYLIEHGKIDSVEKKMEMALKLVGITSKKGKQQIKSYVMKHPDRVRGYLEFAKEYFEKDKGFADSCRKEKTQCLPNLG